jgi:hypothetical protein
MMIRVVRITEGHPNALALLRVNRWISAEAASVFYGTTTFRFCHYNLHVVEPMGPGFLIIRDESRVVEW